MLGKDTVLILTNEESQSAELIKNELNNDTKYLGIIVDEKNLIIKRKIIINKIFEFLKLKIWKSIARNLHTLFDKIKVPNGPYLYDRMQSKRVYNMLFRYAPCAVIVNSALNRFSLEKSIQKTGMNIKLLVVSDDIGFDDAIIGEKVTHYFVDNINIRNNLLRQAISAEEIDVNPLPISKDFFLNQDMGIAKQKLGFEPTRHLAVIFLNSAEQSWLIDYAGSHNEIIDFAFRCNKKSNLSKSVSDKKGVLISNNTLDVDIFSAMDIVITPYNPFIIKRASAMNKPIIIIKNFKEENETIDYLVADGKIIVASDVQSLNEALEKFELGVLSLTNEEVDENSVQNIVEKIKEIIIKAKK